MKNKTALIALFALITFSFSTSAQNRLTSKDSINTFYDSLFHIMSTEYLNKDKVNWKNLISDAKQNLEKHETFLTSLNEVKSILEKAKASHCQVFFGDKSYSIGNKEPDEEEFSKQWMKKYSSYKDGEFEVKLLDGKYGYVFIPGWNFEDISSENIHEHAQPFYDAINSLNKNHKIDGWIIDLRLNFGGNSYPMLLGLYDLLGDNKIWGSLDLNGKLINDITLKSGVYLDNNKKISSIEPKGEKATKSKVAIVTSIVSASSGEIVALAFKGREETIFIGQKSYGATTSNDKRDLPFGAFMALTTGIDCDRNGNSYEKIEPDILVLKGDNFDDLLKDKNIIKAIQYFKSKK